MKKTKPSKKDSPKFNVDKNSNKQIKYNPHITGGY